MKRPRGVEIVADLRVSVAESVARVSALDDEIRVRFASLSDAIAFWRHSDRQLRSAIFSLVRPILAAAETELHVEIGADTVATLRPGRRGSLAGRLLGIPPLKLLWGTLFRRLLGAVHR